MGDDRTSGEVTRAFVIRGRVQGVGFRWATKQEADRLGLEGAVWNRRDGAVEVHARGPAESVLVLERWLAQGPGAARVEGVERLVPAGEGIAFAGFRIERREDGR